MISNEVLDVYEGTDEEEQLPVVKQTSDSEVEEFNASLSDEEEPVQIHESKMTNELNDDSTRHRYLKSQVTRELLASRRLQ